MKVYVITVECADSYYGPEFEGHIFSNRELAEKYLASPDLFYPEVVEVELDES